MIIIACIDEKNGMMFNRRRQSRDRILREDILQECQGKSLWMNPYSYGLFADNPPDGITVSEDFLTQAGDGDYCFIEDADITGFLPQIQEIILYQWNRRYPADTYFPINLTDGNWELMERTEFAGSSHERITKEHYRRKNEI